MANNNHNNITTRNRPKRHTVDVAALNLGPSQRVSYGWHVYQAHEACEEFEARQLIDRVDRELQHIAALAKDHPQLAARKLAELKEIESEINASRAYLEKIEKERQEPEGEAPWQNVREKRRIAAEARAKREADRKAREERMAQFRAERAERWERERKARLAKLGVIPKPLVPLAERDLSCRPLIYRNELAYHYAETVPEQLEARDHDSKLQCMLGYRIADRRSMFKQQRKVLKPNNPVEECRRWVAMYADIRDKRERQEGKKPQSMAKRGFNAKPKRKHMRAQREKPPWRQ